MYTGVSLKVRYISPGFFPCQRDRPFTHCGPVSYAVPVESKLQSAQGLWGGFL